jgi:hypothetical protein
MRLIYFFISIIFSLLIIGSGVQHMLSPSKKDLTPRTHCPGFTIYDRQFLSILRKDIALPIYNSRLATHDLHLLSSLRKFLTPRAHGSQPTTHDSRFTLHASRLTLHDSRLLILDLNWLSILRKDIDPDTAITDTIMPAGEVQPEQSVAADTVIQETSAARQQNPWLWQVNYFAHHHIAEQDTHGKGTEVEAIPA